MVQINALALAMSGSSRVPPRMMIRVGLASDSLSICVPQAGQKRPLAGWRDFHFKGSVKGR